MPDKTGLWWRAAVSVTSCSFLTARTKWREKNEQQAQQTCFLGLFSISLCSDSIRWFRPSNKLCYNKHLFILHNLPVLVEFSFCVFFSTALDIFQLFLLFCCQTYKKPMVTLFWLQSHGTSPGRALNMGMKQHVWQLSSAHNLADKLHWGQEHEPVTTAQTHI